MFQEMFISTRTEKWTECQCDPLLPRGCPSNIVYLLIFSPVNTDCRWLEMGVFNQSSNSGYCHTFWTFHQKPCAMSIVYMCTWLQRPKLFDWCLRPGILGSKTQEKDRTGTPESFSLSVWGGVLVGIFFVLGVFFPHSKLAYVNLCHIPF